MTRPQNYFTELSGTAVHYARAPVAPYATRGKSYRFYVIESFEQSLVACFKELWKVCPFGQADVLTSAGAYVNKSGYHGLGRGFDLDAIFWPERDFVTLNYPSDPVFYLGVEAILRRHFGTVLNYLYNRAHRDHFHIDNGTSVKFTSSSTSRVYFLQAALTHVLDIPVLIDGKYGSQTSGATNKALKNIGSTGKLESANTWKALLLSIAETAFNKVEQEMSPPYFLRQLYNTIEHELDDTEQRKKIETALNVFVNHDDVETLLGKYDDT